MKVIRIVAFTLFLSIVVSGLTQKADAQFAIEGGLGYGADIERLGFKGHVIYDIDQIDELYFSGGLMFYVPESTEFGDSSYTWLWTELNLNGEFHFLQEDNFNVYGLAGLNRTRFTQRVNGSTSTGRENGVNIGAGFQADLEVALLDLQLKYVLDGIDQAVLAAGLRIPI